MRRKSWIPTLAALSLLAGCSPAADVKARNGVLDLRNTDGAASMTGEWIVLEDGKTHTAPVHLRPGKPSLPPSRPASWMLSVLVSTPGDWEILVPFPGYVSAVYQDNVLLWNSSASASHLLGPARVPFRGGSSGLIRVEVPAGGLSPGSAPLAFAPYMAGSSKDLEAYKTMASVLTGTALGLFGTIALTALALSLFYHGGKGPLALAGLMFGTLAFHIVRSAPVLGLHFLPPETLDRLYICTLSIQSALLAALALALFPKLLKGAARLAVLAPPLAVAAAAWMPAEYLGIPYIASVAWFGALCLALAAYCAFLALRGKTSTLHFLGALLFLAASLAARWAFGDSLLLAAVLEPAALGAFALLAALTLIQKLGRAFDEAENLTAYVDSVSTTVKRFIPMEFMEYLQKRDITDLRLGDHVEKEMTIFFSDIRAFTKLSEELTPEENFAFINSYLARMVPLITESGGFVDKYVGDAIMALFPDKGGADQALRTALEMQSRVVEYNEHRASVGYRPIEMGIGIHTGTLMLGVVGVQDRMENTVISDSVNLSSRLQAIAKAFNIGVVISEQSFKSLDDPGLFKYRFIGKVRVKGKAAPVSCFEMFGDTHDQAFEFKMKANTFFEQGMLSYYQKSFVDATYYFKRALEILPRDGASRFYLETCLHKTR